jgi:hypothetical protein
MYELIPRRITAVLNAEVVQHHISIEIRAVSIVVSLFCLTPVYIYQITWRHFTEDHNVQDSLDSKRDSIIFQDFRRIQDISDATNLQSRI